MNKLSGLLYDYFYLFFNTKKKLCLAHEEFFLVLPQISPFIIFLFLTYSFQQLIPSDESDPEMEFLKSLSASEKKKLLR